MCADLASALRFYGTAFDRCPITEPAHPPRGHPEHLADACTRYAASAHQHRGRLGELAAATADTIGLLSPELTVAARWAVTVAIADTALDLIALTADAAPLRHLAAVSAHRQLTRRLTDTLHLAAQHPPNANATAILDRPLPAGPHVSAASTTHRLTNAAAGILYHTRPGQPMALSELLAVTIALESLSDTAGRLRAPDDQRPPDHAAANEWHRVQRIPRPLNDGTRRHQSDTSPVVGYAIDLHRALPKPGATPSSDTVHAVGRSLDHVPTISRHLIAALHRASDTGTLLGFACDLDTGPRHPIEYLAGHRPGGLIPAGPRELRPITIAIADAATLTHQLRHTTSLHHLTRQELTIPVLAPARHL